MAEYYLQLAAVLRDSKSVSRPNGRNQVKCTFKIIEPRFYSNNYCFRHLSLLCTFVLKPIGRLGPELRLRSLGIMRNFAFNVASRPALLASDELMYVLRCVLDKGTPAEHLIVTTLVWRLVANCYKAKHIFRCGSVVDSLWSLKGRIEEMHPLDDEQKEVGMVIDALRLILEK